MKHSLWILLVIGLSAAIPVAAHAQGGPLGPEDPVSGFVGAIPGTGIQVASDGEFHFDPFGYGADTSDGISFPSDWHVLPTPYTAQYWVQLLDPNNQPTNTWVLPASDIGWGAENNNTFEPIGTWQVVSSTAPLPSQGRWWIVDPDGAIGDIIDIEGNSVSFWSDADVPEPSCVVALAGMCGMGLAGFVWRRRTA
jgi:hypothetical protein